MPQVSCLKYFVSFVCLVVKPYFSLASLASFAKKILRGSSFLRGKKYCKRSGGFC
jgi:hypothetical protein